MDFTPHLSHFKEHGYTIFSDFVSKDWVKRIRGMLDPKFNKMFSESPEKYKISVTPLVDQDELGPLLKEHALDSRILDFMELLIGPFVQLDSYRVAGFPSTLEENRGSIHFWHRDNFHVGDTYAKFVKAGESKPYTSPLACNFITYLQDMNEETGPFYFIPGSHLDYTIIESEGIHTRHPRQQPLSMKAGDLVVLHHDVLHTGSDNTSLHTRYFISNYVCRIGLPHRDPFDGSFIQSLLREARVSNNVRLMRFFGEDNNFLDREERIWKTLIDEERIALL